MAINPAFLTCAVCGESNAYPFSFGLSAAARAAQEQERAAQVGRHEAQQARGSGGPQFTWSHSTEALLCTRHRDRVGELDLLEVPMEEALKRLRVDAGLPAQPQGPHRPAAPMSLWDRCLQWWSGR